LCIARLKRSDSTAGSRNESGNELQTVGVHGNRVGNINEVQLYVEPG